MKCIVCGETNIPAGAGHWKHNSTDWWACSFEHWKIQNEKDKEKEDNK